MSNFRVGQKVVCVNDRAVNGWGKPPLSYGEIYTVASIGDHAYGGSWVTLLGVDHLPTLGFKALRFRPLVERKTSIEIFQRMLTPSQVDA